MTVALLPSLVTTIAPTLAVGGAAGRPHRALSAIMVTTIAADRYLKDTVVAILVLAAAPVNAPSAVISPPQPPATPAATVQSP